MKKLVGLILCLVMALATFGVSALAEADGTVYLLHKGLDYYAWAAMQEAFVLYCKDNGVKYEVLNAKNDVSTQVQQFKTVLAQSPKAIVVTAIDSSSLVDCVKEANEAGIPVAVYDTPITGDGIQMPITVDCDNYQAGKQQAEIVVAKLIEKYGAPEGKVLDVYGDLSSQVMIERKGGFDEVMAQYPDIKVVEAQGNGDRSKSQDAASNALAANEDMDAVCAPCDNAFYGVYEAVEAAGKLVKIGEPGHIIMVSLDGEPLALDRITEGYMDGTVALDWHAIAAICMELTEKYYFNGQEMPATYEAKDSYFKFAWENAPITDAKEWTGKRLSLPTHIVTAENAQDATNGGRYAADVLKIDY